MKSTVVLLFCKFCENITTNIAHLDNHMRNRLEQMRNNPRADWRIADIEAICREYGIRCEASRSGSSHYKITHAAMRDILTLPFKRPIKPVYIRKLVAFIDAVRDLS